MDVLIFSFTAMAPVLFSAAIGWMIRWRGMVDDAFIAKFNQVVFKVFMPLMLFNNIYRIDFRAEFNRNLVLFAVAMLLFVVSALLLILPHFIKERDKLATTIHATFRSNYIIYAIPIITSMFGEPGARIAAMLSPIAIIIYNFISVIIMCHFSNNNNQPRSAVIKSTLLDILRNPLIIASVTAVLFALSGLRPPQFMIATLSTLGALGSPTGLILMGAQLDWKTLSGNFRAMLAGCTIRLVIIPTIALSFAIALGFRGAELGTIFMLFGTPSAVSSSVMARHYNLAPRYAAQLVVASTVLSLFTIFVGISILRAAGLL